MTPNKTLARLQSLGDEKVRKHNLRWGADTNQYGVKLGEIRKLAKTIKTNHTLALDLWKTSYLGARLLAVLVMDPKKLSAEALVALVKSATISPLADWLNLYVVKIHPGKESIQQKWMHANYSMTVCAGWSLTRGRVAKDPEGLPHFALLHHIKPEMPGAAPEVQWTKNLTWRRAASAFPNTGKRPSPLEKSCGSIVITQFRKDVPCRMRRFALAKR